VKKVTQLFWIGSAALIALAGCATAPKPTAVPLTGDQSRHVLDFATVLTNIDKYHPVKDIPHQEHMFPTAAGNAKDGDSQLLAKICNGKDAIFTPHQTVRLIVPPVYYSGNRETSIEEAQKQRDRYVTFARNFIREKFFTLGSRNQIVSDRTKMKEDQELNKSAGWFYSLPTNDEKGLIEFYQAHTTLVPGNQLALVKLKANSNVVYMVPNKFEANRLRQISRNGYGWVVEPEKNPLLMVDVHTTETLESGYGDGPHEITYNKAIASSMFVVSDEAWKRTDTGSKFYPLDLFAYADMDTLQNKFTVLVPPEVQDKYFKEGRGLAYCGSGNHCGYTQDGQVSSKKLLEDQYAIWEKYFKAFTEVAESPGTDPSIINFDITLKTDLFCKYGRAKSDFVAHR
jgi:hypothetical protein